MCGVHVSGVLTVEVKVTFYHVVLAIVPLKSGLKK